MYSDRRAVSAQRTRPSSSLHRSLQALSPLQDRDDFDGEDSFRISPPSSPVPADAPPTDANGLVLLPSLPPASSSALTMSSADDSDDLFVQSQAVSRSSSRCVGLDLDRSSSPTGSTSSSASDLEASRSPSPRFLLTAFKHSKPLTTDSESGSDQVCACGEWERGTGCRATVHVVGGPCGMFVSLCVLRGWGVRMCLCYCMCARRVLLLVSRSHGHLRCVFWICFHRVCANFPGCV